MDWQRHWRGPASRLARVWIPSERATLGLARRDRGGGLRDGAVIVEIGIRGRDWLVRRSSRRPGDAVVLEPVDAREAVLAAARKRSAG